MKKLYITLFLTAFSITNLFSQAGDCPALCVTSDQTATTAVDGSTNELGGFATCLSANEASSSYWYQVCFSSNGTFAFSMNPVGDYNDFDFAIWSGTNCPPTANSIRCSFAATGAGGPPCSTCDDTGLGNGSTQTSEDATGDGWLQPITVSNGQCITMCINNYGAGSDVFDLDFTGTATMTCVGTLPIVLSNFIATPTENSVILNWVSQSERNNNYYTIEKSIDGVTFAAIGQVNGAGNSSVKKAYKLIDDAPSLGTSYYRLSQTDFDGAQQYFNIESVNWGKSFQYKVNVYALSGLLQKSFTSSDVNTELNNDKELMNGLYIIETIDNNNNHKSFKFVKKSDN